MDLDLDITALLKPGPRQTVSLATVVRELRAEDLPLLLEGRGVGVTALKRISERHHAVARLMAEGMTDGEIGLRTGYSISRLIMLRGDDTFKELLVHYKSMVRESFQDLQDRLYGIAADAIDTLRDRLEDDPDSLSTGQLVDISKMGADRSGFGPQSSQTNLNVTMNIAERMDAARKRARAAMAPIEDAEIISGPKGTGSGQSVRIAGNG